jgi:flagellar biosynthetic protein FliP
MKARSWLLLLGLVGAVSLAWGQDGGISVPSIQIGVGGATGREQLSTSLQILALLTVLSVAPAILILTTAFTRIVIVLSLVRTALGTASIPPNQVLVGLSLFLTFYVMGPTYEEVNRVAIQPYLAKKDPISFDEALSRAQEPVKKFMLKNTYESDLQLFLDLRGQKPANRGELDILSLVPAFVISELKTAFIVGFYIFLPFVILDLIVASVLMGMGMMMMPPVVVSLPAKILVFVLADGWAVVVRTLLSGYG